MASVTLVLNMTVLIFPGNDHTFEGHTFSFAKVVVNSSVKEL